MNALGQDCLFCEAWPVKDASENADCPFWERADVQTALYTFAFSK